MTEVNLKIHQCASGEIEVWVDPGGAICIKTRHRFEDPVELAEHEALALANLLTQLVQQQRGESEAN